MKFYGNIPYYEREYHTEFHQDNLAQYEVDFTGRNLKRYLPLLDRLKT